MTAANAGADYLGFILWDGSKRAAKKRTVAGISAALKSRPKPPKLIGVFVNSPIDEVAATLDQCNLDFAQLHGDEPLWQITDPDSPLFGKAFKAIRPTSAAEAHMETARYLPLKRLPNQPALLIDAYHPQLPGGTGAKTDWTIARTLTKENAGIFLAGGLTPENVSQAVRSVQPFGVDVASGVETAPGEKSHELVKRFIYHARQSH